MSSNDTSPGGQKIQSLQSKFHSESLCDKNPFLSSHESERNLSLENEDRVDTRHDSGRESASGPNRAKLFVGQVPRTCSESDLIPIFGPYGPLADISIIRDRASLDHRGCAFVTFQNADDAERAIMNVHDKVQFETGKLPLQVRFATVPGRNRSNEFGESGALELV